jgi:hypothetical protein
VRGGGDVPRRISRVGVRDGRRDWWTGVGLRRVWIRARRFRG